MKTNSEGILLSLFLSKPYTVLSPILWPFQKTWILRNEYLDQGRKILYAVFPHIVAAATILFWNCSTVKKSYSFLTRVRKLFTLRSLLNELACLIETWEKGKKVFKGGKCMRKYGTSSFSCSAIHSKNIFGL